MRRPLNWVVVCLSLLFLIANLSLGRKPAPSSGRPPVPRWRETEFVAHLSADDDRAAIRLRSRRWFVPAAGAAAAGRAERVDRGVVGVVGIVRVSKVRRPLLIRRDIDPISCHFSFAIMAMKRGSARRLS